MVSESAQAAPALVFHYDEIGLKGGNRKAYERIFLRRVQEQLARERVRLERLALTESRAIARLAEPLGEDAWEKVLFRLERTPGIAAFGRGFVLPKDAGDEAVAQTARALVPFLAKKGATFRVTARRSDKAYPRTSIEIEQWLGEVVAQTAPELTVSLRAPHGVLFVEVLSGAIVLWVREKGVGGLPVGASGDAVCLLSAGFDSPVASYLMMKRGVRVHWLHFYDFPATSDEARFVARELAGFLARFGDGAAHFALMNMNSLTRHLRARAPERLRVVLLRRSMMRLAERWARALGGHALITGESVGQVASQTLENLETIEAATALPVLRPLSGSNKNEITQFAQWLGTHELSSRKCEDVCGMLTPRHPATKSNPDVAREIEARLGITEIEEVVFQTLEVEKIAEEG